MARGDHDERQVEWCEQAGRVVLAATRANVQYVNLNTLCTARRLTIGLTRSRPVRPRTGGRLEKIEDSTAENGGRLEKIEDMLGHLQNVLDDIQANHDADEPNSDQGQHNVRLPLAVACQISYG